MLWICQQNRENSVWTRDRNKTNQSYNHRELLHLIRLSQVPEGTAIFSLCWRQCVREHFFDESIAGNSIFRSRLTYCWNIRACKIAPWHLRAYCIHVHEPRANSLHEPPDGFIRTLQTPGGYAFFWQHTGENCNGEISQPTYVTVHFLTSSR